MADVQVHASPNHSSHHHNGINGHSSSSKSSSVKSVKTLRYADDLVSESTLVDDLLKSNAAPGKRRSASEDRSVERYFDNLITMIEDAAEGL